MTDHEGRARLQVLTSGGRGIYCGELGAVGWDCFNPVFFKSARPHTIKCIIISQCNPIT